MDKILHDPKDPKLWELWYIPYNGQSRILSINRMEPVKDEVSVTTCTLQGEQEPWGSRPWNAPQNPTAEVQGLEHMKMTKGLRI